MATLTLTSDPNIQTITAQYSLDATNYETYAGETYTFSPTGPIMDAIMYPSNTEIIFWLTNLQSDVKYTFTLNLEYTYVSKYFFYHNQETKEEYTNKQSAITHYLQILDSGDSGLRPIRSQGDITEDHVSGIQDGKEWILYVERSSNIISKSTTITYIAAPEKFYFYNGRSAQSGDPIDKLNWKGFNEAATKWKRWKENNINYTACIAFSDGPLSAYMINQAYTYLNGKNTVVCSRGDPVAASLFSGLETILNKR